MTGDGADYQLVVAPPAQQAIGEALPKRQRPTCTR
jgi:hypothetical protein